ncbi:MAG: DUF86 domain-containing protein [Proteobacteria bacterium]|nr:DUF86 domain-containing protein [Pseudomonadota bacterium]
MPEFRYAGGRILESIRYMSEELAEFQNDYAGRTFKEYQADRKLQKLIDRTVETVLTALIEVCGTFLTEEGIAVESYADALRKTSERLGFGERDQNDLAALAIHRNRLAHRYLNFRWQTIRFFSDRRDLIAAILARLLAREKHQSPR